MFAEQVEEERLCQRFVFECDSSEAFSLLLGLRKSEKERQREEREKYQITLIMGEYRVFYASIQHTLCS